MIEGLHNFRDTGGMPLVGGGATRPGVLYRSDALSDLTPRGLEQLASTDIGVIVDLRTPSERQMAPDRLPTSRAFRRVELSVLEGAVGGLAQQAMQAGLQEGDPETARQAIAEAMRRLPTLSELYLGMLGHGAALFAEVARLVAAATPATPTAVLVHCTAGKDRTGVATALVLDAVGADRGAIVADYASSQDNLAGAWADGMFATIARMGAPRTPGLEALVALTPPAAIERALSWVDERGGSAAYLASGGLTDAELDTLRDRLRA